MSHPYLQLTKPGIVMGNVIAAAGGFLLASRGSVNWVIGSLVLVSVALVVSSGCVLNNVIDRDIDGLMRRTQRRPTVTGRISPLFALGFGALLGIGGTLLLYAATRRLLPVALLILGFLVYVGLYSLYMKRHSIYGTLVGSIAGAMPPVVGYCAANHRFDAGALTILIIFSLWQIPHSYAIAIFRERDYRAASIPVLPLVIGLGVAKRSMVCHILAFIIATVALGIIGCISKISMIVAVLAGVYWLVLTISKRSEENASAWAKSVFITSIGVVMILSVTFALDCILVDPHRIGLFFG